VMVGLVGTRVAFRHPLRQVLLTLSIPVAHLM
jgi:hypothetical protein